MDFNLIDDKRRAKRLTIVQLCDKVGIDQSTYHTWKSNPKKMKVETLCKIIDALDMDESEKLQLFQ